MKIIVLVENNQKDESCGCEHGLSVYIETEKHKVLLDTGTSGLFVENADKLKVDLKEVDTVILSHGHYDHGGGILRFVDINPNAVIYMQRNAFDDFYHGEKYIGIDKSIKELKQLRLLDGEYLIDDELSIFTNITGRKFWPESNKALTKRENGAEEQDDFSHEECLVVSTNNNRILLSGCAHNGILNILDRYKEIYGGEPDVVISGFHMMKKTDYTEKEIDTIRKTANELSKTKTVFYTGHCTGQKAFDLMKPIMGNRLIQIYSGMRLI